MRKTKGFLALLLAVTMVIGGIPFGMFTANADAEHSCSDSNSCTVCTVAEMINALPEKEEITISNAASVVAQIHDIDRIKGNLTDDEYLEMLQLVEAGNDGSGYGLDVPLRYEDAVDAVTKLNAGGSLYIQKKYDVGDAELDWNASDATFMIERIDDGSFTPFYATLSELPPVATSLDDYGMYSVDEFGWTNSYPLPAGTYRITETGYNAVTVQGEVLTTTATCSFDGQEGTDSAVVTEVQTLEFTNTYARALTFKAVSSKDQSSITEGQIELLDQYGTTMSTGDFNESYYLSLESLNENEVYTVRISHEDYVTKEYPFYFYSVGSGFSVFDGNDVELNSPEVTIELDPIDVYDVYPASGEIEYGSSLDSFVDFEKTTLNGELITDEQAKETLIDYLGYTLTDKDGNPVYLHEISTMPVGEYTMSVEKTYNDMPGITIHSPTTIKIIPRTLTLDDFAISVLDKSYDGSLDAVVTAVIDPALASMADFTINVVGQFADVNAGEDKEVSFVLTITETANFVLEGGAISGTATASISKTLVDSVNVAFDELTIGEEFPALDDSLSQGVNRNLTWKMGNEEASGKVAYNTTYTAVVELYADQNHYLDNADTTVTINGEEITFTLDANDGIVYEKEFTTRAPYVTSLGTLETITKANGVSVEDLKASLPGEIQLTAEDDENYTGTIQWDIDDFDQYQQDKLDEQTFTISGIVNLPEGVTNGMQISLGVEQTFVIQQRQIDDQDGDNKPEPDTDGDNIYEGTAGEEDYIPDQDGDGEYEVDDNKDSIFDNEDDTKHYVPDGNGGFVPYFYPYEVSDEVLTWTLGGSEDLTFTVEGPVEKFTGLLLNDTAVDASNYSYVSGSTVITLKAGFLNSLSVGEYPLVADYVDGSGETTLKIVAAAGGNGQESVPGDPTGDGTGNTPDDNNGDNGNKEKGEGVDTGDHNTLTLWLLTALTAMAAFVTCHFTTKKNH